MDALQCHWGILLVANNRISDLEELKKQFCFSKSYSLIRTLERGGCWVGLEKGSAKRSNPLHSLFLYNLKTKKGCGHKKSRKKMLVPSRPCVAPKA